MNNERYSMTSYVRGFLTSVKSAPARQLLMLSALAWALPLSVSNVYAAAPTAAAAPAGASSTQPAKTTELNSDGSALTPPDTLLYDGQLAQMQKLQRDNLQLKLELEQAQLREKLRAAEDKGNNTGRGDPRDRFFIPTISVTSSAPASASSALPQIVPVYVAPPELTPSVISMTGVGNVRQALLDVPTYGQLMVRGGDLLPNNWKVVNIDDGGVIVIDTTGAAPKRMRLPYYVQPADTTSSGGQFAQSR